MGWLEDFKYRMRTLKPKLMQRLDDNTYYGGNLGGVTITKKRKKPYKWVSPRGAGNMTVMPGDPEMVFFAPIAAGAGIAASPAITNAVGSAMSGINTAGDALAATAAGQRLTSGLNFVGNAVKSSKAWPWMNAGLTSLFAAQEADKIRRGDIHNVGDVVEAGLGLLPLSQLARPVANTAGRIGNTVRETVNSAVDKFPWTYRIPENPNMAYRRMGPLERDWLMEGNELSTRDTNILTEAESKAARTDPKYNITTKNGLRFNFFKAGAEHGGRKQFAKGQPWRGTTVTHGEEQVLAIPGKDLPWVSGRHYEGPQGTGFRVGDVPFEEAPFGSHIDLLTEEGYTGVNPSLLNGSVIYSPFKILGRNFGYRKLYPMNTSTPRGLLSNEPLIAGGVPKITAENAVNITPAQWTAAQDAAIARGDMVEAQRLRDLHAKVKGYSPTDEWHGSNKIFNDFKETTHGIYFTPDEAGAKGYMRGINPTKYRVYLNKGSDRVSINNEGLPWNKIEEIKAAEALGLSKETLYSMAGHYNRGAQPWYVDFLSAFGYRPKTNYYAIDQIAKVAKQQGKTSLDITNVLDNGKKISAIKNYNYDLHIVFKPNQIKLADAVTYDNNGVRIPLGKRDNFKLNDIRYSWLAPFLGLGTLGTLLNKQ